MSWQIVPTRSARACSATRTAEKSQRVMQAMLKMKKIEIDELEDAAALA